MSLASEARVHGPSFLSNINVCVLVSHPDDGTFTCRSRRRLWLGASRFNCRQDHETRSRRLREALPASCLLSTGCCDPDRKAFGGGMLPTRPPPYSAVVENEWSSTSTAAPVAVMPHTCRILLTGASYGVLSSPSIRVRYLLFWNKSKAVRCPPVCDPLHLPPRDFCDFFCERTVGYPTVWLSEFRRTGYNNTGD